jgi:hypothetical protein
MPVSEARLRANRLNSLHSTGPRTPEGKAASSQNARTHGLTAQTLPLIGNESRRFKKMAAKFRAYYSPEDAIEEDIIDRLIMARSHLSNAERLLSGYFDIIAAPDLPEPKRPTERSICRRLAKGFMDDVGKNAFTKIMRYKQDAQRTADRLHPILDDYRLRTAVRDYWHKRKPTSEPAESPQPTESTPEFKPDTTPPRGNDTYPETKRWPYAEVDRTIPRRITGRPEPSPDEEKRPD